MLNRPYRTGCWVSVFLCLSFGLVACKKSASSSTEPAASASRKPELRCQPVASDATFRLRATGAAKAEPGLPSPFAIELGRVATYSQGVLIPHLNGDGHTTHAAVALVPYELGRGEVLDLGVVRADSAPPQVAASLQRLVVVLSDADASGESYRVGARSLVGGVEAKLEWWATFDGGDDKSAAFDVADGASGAVVVWDDWERAESRGKIMGALVAEGEPVTPIRHSPPAIDAESPRVIASGNGFWVAWIALGEPESAETSDSEEQPLRVTHRWIQVLRLDERGRPTGPALDVTPRDRFAVGFDWIAGHADSALIAWRDDASTPGISGGTVFLTRVGVDGSTATKLLLDEDVGTGVPALLFDPDPNFGAPHGWLAIAGSDGGTRLTALSPDGTPLPESKPPLTLGESVALLAQGGRIWFAKPRGRDIELQATRCGLSHSSD